MNHFSLTARLTTALALLWSTADLRSASAGETLLSSFEGDLTSSLGVNWSTGRPHAFVPNGATQGTAALEFSHNTGWTQDFMLDGGGPLAQLVAASDRLLIDATVPGSAAWRQMYVVMQGDGQGWSQHQFDLPSGATTTVALDLQSTGLKANAGGGGQSWWQLYLIFQGGDDPTASPIITTIDNVRFFAVPEPAALSLIAAGTAIASLTRRRR
jgi:hypothetical protein